jgi:ATP synthase protein I
LLQASTVGLNLVLSTFVGLAIGYGLDKFFNSSPWLTIIFLILGIIAGFRELVRIAKKQDNGSDTEDK